MARGSMLVVVLAGCGPTLGDGDGGGDAGETSTGGSDSMGSTGATTAATSDPGTTVPGSTVTTDSDASVTVATSASEGGEGPCPPDPCDACPDGCIDDNQCVLGQWTCACICDQPCPDVAAQAEAFAMVSKTPSVACGSVGVTDTPEAWQAVHDCVLGQLAQSGGFWALWSTDELTSAIAGAVGESYALALWELSGFGTEIRYDCAAISPILDCVVTVGEMCLSCVEQTEAEVLCDLK